MERLNDEERLIGELWGDRHVVYAIFAARAASDNSGSACHRRHLAARKADRGMVLRLCLAMQSDLVDYRWYPTVDDIPSVATIVRIGAGTG